MRVIFQLETPLRGNVSASHSTAPVPTPSPVTTAPSAVAAVSSSPAEGSEDRAATVARIAAQVTPLVEERIREEKGETKPFATWPGAA